MQLTFDEIVSVLNAQVILDSGKVEFKGLETDTRRLGENFIFVGLKGERVNGNDLIPNAAENGATLCIVDEFNFTEETAPKGISIIKVEDSRTALIELAKYYLKKFDLKIVALTGSTGKTSTKDLTAAALSGKYKVFKTIGNYNSDIGLPLMIFKLDTSIEVAVFEMGMSNLGEIELLADIARPQVAAITNIGISHIENLKSRDNILKAKLEIASYFGEENTLIINTDDDMLGKFEKESSVPYQISTIGTKDNENYHASGIFSDGKCIEFIIRERNTKVEEKIKLDIPGQHNVLNSMLAISISRKLGLTFNEIKEGLKNLEQTSMRLDIEKYNGITIINDAYNASPDSMKAAIEVLSSTKAKRRIAILGDMKELGEDSINFHKEVGENASERKIDILMATGEFSSGYEQGFDGEFMKFENKQQMTEKVKELVQDGDAVLVKASRSVHFETIVEEIKR